MPQSHFLSLSGQTFHTFQTGLRFNIIACDVRGEIKPVNVNTNKTLPLQAGYYSL